MKQCSVCSHQVSGIKHVVQTKHPVIFIPTQILMKLMRDREKQKFSNFLWEADFSQEFKVRKTVILLNLPDCGF